MSKGMRTGPKRRVKEIGVDLPKMVKMEPELYSSAWREARLQLFSNFNSTE